jgi:hypothetical protein
VICCIPVWYALCVGINTTRIMTKVNHLTRVYWNRKRSLCQCSLHCCDITLRYYCIAFNFNVSWTLQTILTKASVCIVRVTVFSHSCIRFEVVIHIWLPSTIASIAAITFSAINNLLFRKL